MFHKSKHIMFNHQYNNSLGTDIFKHLVTDKIILHNLDDIETAEAEGLSSNMGRRNAYNALMLQQRQDHGTCYITFFCLLTYNSLKKAPTEKSKRSKAPLLMTLNSTGTHEINYIKYHKHIIILLFQIIIIGEIQNAPQKFQVGEIVYGRYRRPIVVNMSPFVPIDDIDERSCYSILLMHTA